MICRNHIQIYALSIAEFRQNEIDDSLGKTRHFYTESEKDA